MDFIDNIVESIGNFFPKEATFKMVIFGDNAAYFESVKGIVGFSPQKITLSLKKGGINLTGENLYIKKFCAGDVVICGKITSMERF